MKNFRVTVNGNTYDVAVEELGESSSPALNTSANKQPAAPAKKSASPQKAAAGGADGNIKVTSPMPGTILDVKVAVGDKVEANSVVVILEAMKMENEIVTPSAGTVASIKVNKGTAVNSGDILVTISE